jgi:hypothetical protein
MVSDPPPTRLIMSHRPLHHQTQAVPPTSHVGLRPWRRWGARLALTLAALGTLFASRLDALVPADLPGCAAAVDDCIALALWLPLSQADARRPWLSSQLQAANRLLAPLRMGVQVTAIADLPLEHTAIAATADRTRLGKYGTQTPLRWFVVQRLVDDQEPTRLRGGVTWRVRAGVWVLVVDDTPPWVLAHELGHVLGLAHDRAPLSVMNKAVSVRRARAVARAGGVRYEPSQHNRMRKTLSTLRRQGLMTTVR